jgi:hypothetical protein
VGAGALEGDQWLVVAGWECQDMSAAGSNTGVYGPKSSTVFPLVNLVGALQQLQTRDGRPPAYIIENTSLQFNFRSARIRDQQFPMMCSILGQPFVLDAAQVGRYAHRVRNYWTNIADHAALEQVRRGVQRPLGMKVNDILDPGRTVNKSKVDEPSWQYPCNSPGEPLSALPTFMAYSMSRAFVQGKPGSIFD